MAKKAGRTTKTVALAIRMAPRARHLVDVMGRAQRRSLTAVIDAAVESYATESERMLADSTWSTDEGERLLSLYREAPHLCSFDEELEAKRALAALHS
ncbi:hypothetical protein ACQKP6_08995 [Pseudomonas fluorescens]|uniref:hypothetical protein n=1 Tax=Pseudomonas fluorescens TaxID=294 RepID=UPI003D049856